VKPTLVKYCGITRPTDAEAAAALGAGAIGLVFAPWSPRFISLDQAVIIRRRLPPHVQAVALLRNAGADEVRGVIEVLQPDLLQFHGEESPSFCESFGRPYWRAVPMAAPADLDAWAARHPSAAALLLDAHAPGEAGGTGRRFDWSRAAAGGKPLVLAGGLTPENVGEAVHRVRPFAVDVSSGIESRPGIKDHDRMRRFMEAVRRADET
jgi:phosphoribosylanthranilate isomerase